MTAMVQPITDTDRAATELTRERGGPAAITASGISCPSELFLEKLNNP